MNISFTLYGMTFDAEVSYTPATPDVHYLPNGDPGYPGDPAELEFHSLTANGQDASFLLDSSLSEGIYDAAQTAAASECLAQVADAGLERYLDREYA